MEIIQSARSADGTFVEIKFGVWRCLICGEIYFGFDRPSHCPMCGSDARQFMVSPDKVREDRDVVTDLTEIDKANLRQSIGMEVGDSRYYTTMSKRVGPDIGDLCATYAKLAKIEAEHCEIFSRLLGEPLPTNLETPTQITATWAMDIAAQTDRERGANIIYFGFAQATSNARLKQVWMSLSRVELEHYSFERTQLETDHRLRRI